MLDSIYNMTLSLTTLKSHFCRKKKKNCLYVRFPKICKQTFCFSILLHSDISLPEATSYDKHTYKILTISSLNGQLA